MALAPKAQRGAGAVMLYRRPARRIDSRFPSGLDRQCRGHADTPLDGTRPSSAPLAMRGVRIMDVQKPLSIPDRQFAASGTVMVRPLLLKPQWMNGLSERLLVSHYENNYGGALRRVDAHPARASLLQGARGAPLRVQRPHGGEGVPARPGDLPQGFFRSPRGHGRNPPPRRGE